MFIFPIGSFPHHDIESAILGPYKAKIGTNLPLGKFKVKLLLTKLAAEPRPTVAAFNTISQLNLTSSPHIFMN